MLRNILLRTKRGREVNYFLTDSLLFPNDNEDELQAAAIRHQAYKSKEEGKTQKSQVERKEENTNERKSDEFTLVIHFCIKVLRGAYMHTRRKRAVRSSETQYETEGVKHKVEVVQHDYICVCLFRPYLLVYTLAVCLQISMFVNLFECVYVCLSVCVCVCYCVYSRARLS